jgi:hypothetical protein
MLNFKAQVHPTETCNEVRDQEAGLSLTESKWETVPSTQL